MAAYRSPGERKSETAPGEVGRANAEANAQSRKTDIAGVKGLTKEGTISISVYNNVKKALASGDYLLTIVDNFAGYSRFLPRSDEQPYWGLFTDNRRGDLSLKLDSSVLQLENTVKSDGSKPTISYKVAGSVSGNKISGTWSHS